MRKSLIAIVILNLFVLSCSSTPHAAAPHSTIPPRPARINHMVFFKLKNPADADELVRDCDAMLATIPGATSGFAGKRFESGRSNVDQNYDVGFYAGFATEEAYAQYVQHPNHVASVNKWKPRWEWIRIEDVLDETP